MTGPDGIVIISRFGAATFANYVHWAGFIISPRRLSQIEATNSTSIPIAIVHRNTAFHFRGVEDQSCTLCEETR
jgi:hypothetical protein